MHALVRQGMDREQENSHLEWPDPTSPDPLHIGSSFIAERGPRERGDQNGTRESLVLMRHQKGVIGPGHRFLLGLANLVGH